MAADDFMSVELAQDLLPGVLTELPGALGLHCVGAGLDAAAGVVTAGARERVPKRTHELASTIRVRRSRVQRRRGYSWPGYASVVAGGPGARQAHLIEEGTASRYQPTPGGGLRFVGRVQPSRYLQGSARANASHALTAAGIGMAGNFHRIQAELRGKSRLRSGTARLAAADV